MTSSELMQLARSNPKDAVIFLSKQLTTDPTPENYEIYAHCLLKLNQLDAAKNAYEQACNLDNTRLNSHFGLAQALQQLGNFSDALIPLQHCLAATPQEIVLLFQIGTCYLQLANIPKAKAALLETIAYEPHHVEALVNVATCFIHEKNYQQAIHYLATAVRLDEYHLPAQYNLACTLMTFKRFLQARNQFEDYLKKAPDDLEAHYHLGFVYLMLEMLDEAQHSFQIILTRNPNHLLAMHNLASIALKQEEPSVALGYYQRILALNPPDEIAAYMQAALTNQTPPRQAPTTYVEALFDQYAERFDEHLQQTLHYQTPELLYQLWCDHMPRNQGLTILDLGCGTGLAGAHLKPHAQQLIGVDLSSEMLQQARAKALYDELHQTELLAYVEATPQHYDLVILADVLVYFGDVTPLFQALAGITTQVLFSIESTDQEHYVLTKHGRYQHQLSEICTLLTACGFQYQIKRGVHLREQNNQAVLGDLVFGFL